MIEAFGDEGGNLEGLKEVGVAFAREAGRSLQSGRIASRPLRFVRQKVFSQSTLNGGLPSVCVMSAHNVPNGPNPTKCSIPEPDMNFVPNEGPWKLLPQAWHRLSNTACPPPRQPGGADLSDRTHEHAQDRAPDHALRPAGCAPGLRVPHRVAPYHPAVTSPYGPAHASAARRQGMPQRALGEERRLPAFRYNAVSCRNCF